MGVRLFLTTKISTINRILPFTYILKVEYLVIVIFSVVCLIGGLLVYMLFYIYIKSRREKKYDKWRLISDLLIRKAVFYDDDQVQAETNIPVTDRAKKLMNKRHFRKLLTEEIVSAKKNITGISAYNLKNLYQQLLLPNYALKNLKSRYWHIKAKAIQELTVMEMDEYVTELISFTNNQNELVRMEAQTAIVQFNGFEGLSFLDAITYPISDWQQIKLLQQLAHARPVDMGIDGWLKSANNSVVVFALKLARNYQLFELHDDILQCLDHTNPHVRLEAINFFCEIYTEDTSDALISRYLKEDLKHQLAMIKAIQNIGSEKDVPFLVSLLDKDDHEIKISAARALTKIGKNGIALLKRHADDKGYPLDQIAMHVKGGLPA